MKSISIQELSDSLLSSRPPAVLDVRLEEEHQAGRIPGAVNHCVFEVSFLERFEEAIPERERSIVIYGESATTAEARMAGEKLDRAGYRNVALLEGGFEAWRHADKMVDGDGAVPAKPDLPDGQHELDLEECRLGWTGRNLLNSHHGTVDIVGGHLLFEMGKLAGGVIEFDFRTLKCGDLAGSELHDVLINHLQDHDFLDAEEFPTGLLTIVSAEPIIDAGPGAENLKIEAELTMRGITKSVEFAASSGIDADGRPAAQAVFSIDRTLWGILYGSGKFFHRLGGHLVNDLVEFEVRILTK